jgi:hypothetical protein
MDKINGSKFLIGEDGKDPFNYDDMHNGSGQKQETPTPTLEGDDLFVSEEEKDTATSSKDDTEEEKDDDTPNDMGSNSIMLLALLIGAFLFMRKK